MQNSFKYLISGFVVLTLISWYVIDSKHSAAIQEGLLIPELQAQINDIDRIVISKNDKTIELLKKDGTWRILQADKFIADANLVANLLLDLRKFKLKEKKTKNPKNHARLGLANSGNNAAITISLHKSASQVVSVSIGKEAQKSQGTYVRRNQQEQVWLSQGILKVKLDSNDWIITTLFDIDLSQIKSVTFNVSDAKSFSVNKFSINKLSPQDKTFVLVDMPENHQLISGLDINELANGLQKFDIESITDKQNLSEKAVLNVVYDLFSGLQYNLSFYQNEDKYIMLVEFSNLGSANQYEQQLGNWAYVIAKYKFDALNKKLPDVTELINEQTSAIQDKTE